MLRARQPNVDREAGADDAVGLRGMLERRPHPRRSVRTGNFRERFRRVGDAATVSQESGRGRAHRFRHVAGERCERNAALRGVIGGRALAEQQCVTSGVAQGAAKSDHRPQVAFGAERQCDDPHPSSGQPLPGRVIAAASTQRSKSSALTNCSCSAASRRLRFPRCAVSAIFAAFS